MSGDQYVQYGCGWSAPQGWRNFDSSPTLRFERLPIIGQLYTKNETRFPGNVEYGDIVKGLPIPPESCKAVYSSHVLEHLALEDFRIALTNTLNILIPGGIFRLVVPDLEYSARKYIENVSGAAASEFIRTTHLGRESRPRGIKGLASTWLGNSQHLWMWDYASIQPELEAAGFIGVRRASFGDSSDQMFQKVEERDRWENCLGVECRKA
ncbi:class I SAM-dependent methyltransferase [Mycolicibacterium sp.]|uniref:class I SAM-dependent methyltransferase n=1 Tax=Mycolicibacterium sp. TaxID=2320850 RepID=UPI0037CBA3C4